MANQGRRIGVADSLFLSQSDLQNTNDSRLKWDKKYQKTMQTSSKHGSPESVPATAVPWAMVRRARRHTYTDICESCFAFVGE